ncbi:MAG: hypothetical protein AAGM22_30780 [Acidobacteriota bacterium]
MPSRKSYPLRLDPKVYVQLRRWADDELRSVNGQIEFLIKRALKQAGRWPPPDGGGGPGAAGGDGGGRDDDSG